MARGYLLERRFPFWKIILGMKALKKNLQFIKLFQFWGNRNKRSRETSSSNKTSLYRKIRIFSFHEDRFYRIRSNRFQDSNVYCEQVSTKSAGQKYWVLNCSFKIIFASVVAGENAKIMRRPQVLLKILMPPKPFLYNRKWTETDSNNKIQFCVLAGRACH